MRPGPTAAGQEREEENSRGSATLSLGTKVRPDLEIGLTRRSPQNLASTSMPSLPEEVPRETPVLRTIWRWKGGKLLYPSVRRSPMLTPSD